MGNLLQTEQTTMPAQAAGQQTLYPKAGSLARMDSTGVEKVILDSNTYAAAQAALIMQVNFGGL